MNLKVLFIFFSSIIFAGIAILFIEASLDEENSIRLEKSTVLYKERIKTCLENDDDLLLNNLLDNLKTQPDVLQISVVENGRIIADTDAGEINSIFQDIRLYKKNTIPSGIFLICDSLLIKNRHFKIILKLSGKTSKSIETLKNNIFTAALIYLIICFIIFASAVKKGIPAKIVNSVLPPKNDDALSFLIGSRTAIVLVLTGDNRVIEASTKALEMFGSDIYGKNISEFKAFNEITEAISKGRKPVLSCGKKYFVL